MSVQATTWVWNYSQAEGNARLVLLAIADGANREGKHSCQSVPTVAEMCKLSERTVQRKITELIGIGELVKVGTSGRYGTHVYDLTLLSPRQNVTPDNMGADPRQNVHDDLTLLSPNPINPNIPKGIYPSSGAQKAHPTKQARSLPEGWMPDPDVVQQMQDELRRMGKQIDFEFEHRKFTDHFNSVGGAKGRKKDWNATWRNWMRTARVERGQQESAWVRREKQFNQEREIYRQMDQQGSYFGAPAITEGKGLELE